MTTPSNQLWIYDTTLRDGAQREGLSVSIEDKLRIARRLDQLGIPFIEGGWPGANPKNVQFFWQLQEEPLIQAKIVAFCSTRRPHMTAAADSMLQAILAAKTRWVTIFGKSWDLHVTAGLQISRAENLAMLQDTIVKVAVDGQNILEAAEGNGPVAALDTALRKALVNFYPQIASFELTDYKVRILDGSSGTAAKTRVLVESSNGHQRWTTVGVSSNILAASYHAVVEGLEYGLLLRQKADAALTLK